jgi:hypothetical protein
VDAVRERLGGRAESLAGIGEIVRINTPGHERSGVVLFASEDRFDVWIGAGQVLRVARSDVEPFESQPPRELLVVSSDARVFSRLQEGEQVHFEPTAVKHDEGTVAEKCRYGALVRRADGSIVGVGFQRLWPAGTGQSH